MGKYFKEDNQRISKVLNGVDVNALSQNSIRTADLKSWILNKLGTLTAKELQQLVRNGDIVKEGGNWAIKNLGSVVKFLGPIQKTESIPEAIVKSALGKFRLVFDILKNVTTVKRTPAMQALFDKYHQVSVLNEKTGTPESKLVSLEELLNQFKNNPGNVKFDNKKLLPIEAGTFDAILRDINKIEEIARVSKFNKLRNVGVAGATVVGVPATVVTTQALWSPEQRFANATRDLGRANRKISELTTNAVGSYAEWLNVADKQSYLNGLNPEKKEAFLKEIEKAKSAKIELDQAEKDLASKK
jgi:hypothetical protein